MTKVQELVMEGGTPIYLEPTVTVPLDITQPDVSDTNKTSGQIQNTE